MDLYSLFLECVEHTYLNTKNSVSYAIDIKGDTLFLWFESSNGMTDWGRNLDFPAVSYGDCKHRWYCHRGFLGAWKEVKPLISPIALDPTFHDIYVVGYSHGAAVALLCHEYIWYHRPDVRANLQGFGFGCPRVVWGITPKAVRERWDNFTVVRNMDDLITHLPPALMGYHHVSTVLEVGRHGSYSMLDAHRPENYLTSLKNL